jgi:hypothetical protein
MQYMISIVLVLAVLVGGLFWANRPQLVLIHASPPANFPTDSFSHEVFEELLHTFVDSNGHVDYERWHSSAESVAQLESYLAAVSLFSPDNAPDRFSTRTEELAYWIYGYNAYVVNSVLANWPIESVTDLKAPIEAIKGLGFFYRLRYRFGGEDFSLLGVETNKIRKRYKDARIHFVLNCASESCPVMRPQLPTGADLEDLLAVSAKEFVSDPQNVSFDHAHRSVILSAIFKWYESDFLNELRTHGLPSERGLIDYVASVAPDSMHDDLAMVDDYDIEFRDYDWTLNNVAVGAGPVFRTEQ